MVYVKFSGGNGYCGCDFEEYEAYDHEVDDDFLNEVLDELVRDNGESFEYVATGWDNDFESEEERESYYSNCSGSWEIITEEEYRENRGQ